MTTNTPLYAKKHGRWGGGGCCSWINMHENEDVPLVDFMHLVFTRMPSGVTVGDSGLRFWVPCLSSVIISLLFVGWVNRVNRKLRKWRQRAKGSYILTYCRPNRGILSQPWTLRRRGLTFCIRCVPARGGQWQRLHQGLPLPCGHFKPLQYNLNSSQRESESLQILKDYFGQRSRSGLTMPLSRHSVQSYSATAPPPPPSVLPWWHVTDSGHSAKTTGGRLHLKHAYIFIPNEVGVGWLCRCTGIVWEPNRKRAHTQAGREHSVTVVSARWATMDWP